jgi:cysteine synthase
VTSVGTAARVTALARIQVTLGALPGAEVLLKLEQTNSSGSIKDRTARGLLLDLENRGLLRAGSVVVESTSGNLGLALTNRLDERGCRFIAVIDPKTPASTRDAMAAAGVRLECVDEADGRGGFLLSRLRRVREIVAAQPGVLWPNQYRNRPTPAYTPARPGRRSWRGAMSTSGQSTSRSRPGARWPGLRCTCARSATLHGSSPSIWRPRRSPVRRPRPRA